jgi:NAD(P)-dependent dehydrogenase (short-subunit alcohol dehydrogenase family)
VLVAGGAGALGTAVTAAFLDAGWRVVASDRAEGALRGLGKHKSLRTMAADLSSPTAARKVAGAAADDADAPLRAVVDLIGGYASGGRVHETAVSEFEQQFRLNLRPAYVLSQASLPHLVSAGGGAIVCVSSRAALRPFRGAAGYITSKAAVLALVDCLAVEYAADHVRVNAVLPSTIDTPQNRAAQPDADHTKWTAPADIAQVIRFLCEDGAGVVTGAHVPV